MPRLLNLSAASASIISRQSTMCAAGSSPPSMRCRRVWHPRNAPAGVAARSVPPSGSSSSVYASSRTAPSGQAESSAPVWTSIRYDRFPLPDDGRNKPRPERTSGSSSWVATSNRSSATVKAGPRSITRFGCGNNESRFTRLLLEEHPLPATVTRVQRIVQTVTKEVEGENDDREHATRDEDQMGLVAPHRQVLVDHRPPARARRLDTDAQVTQRGLQHH